MTIDNGLLVKRLIEHAYSSNLIMEAIRGAEQYSLPDWCIVGGVIRDSIWAIVDGYDSAKNVKDIDLLYFDPFEISSQKDIEIEGALHQIAGIPWSVKNQARMHLRNNDAPYNSVNDALFCAPDTISSISVCRNKNSEVFISSCFGYEDFGNRIFRPTPHYMSKYSFLDYASRVRSKGWMQKWPNAKLAPW